jgi:hypothetical protein
MDILMGAEWQRSEAHKQHRHRQTPIQRHSGAQCFPAWQVRSDHSDTFLPGGMSQLFPIYGSCDKCEAAPRP